MLSQDTHLVDVLKGAAFNLLEDGRRDVPSARGTTIEIGGPNLLFQV